MYRGMAFVALAGLALAVWVLSAGPASVAAVSDAEGLAVLGGAYCGIETRQVEYACGYTDPPDPQECEMIPGLGPVDSGEWNVGNQNRTCYAGAMECSTQSLPVYRWAATCD